MPRDERGHDKSKEPEPVTRLRLTFACGNYDRMAALRTGDVAVEGIDLNYIAIDQPREIFDRMGWHGEFDLAEFSSSEFISRYARGDRTLVALPVFPSRVFRHGYIYINRHSGIRVPKDLERRRVGVGLYTQTAAVWIRGHLAHQYGVDLSTIRWVEGAVEKGGPHGHPNAPPLLKPVAIERNDSGRSLTELLAAGAIDALAPARHPQPHPDIVPLFADAKAVERAYYIETRIFPIMHLVAIRRDRYERDPWIATSLYKAFVEAKNCGLAQFRRAGVHAYMLPWIDHDVREIDEVFGGDPWPYGIEPNRPTLEALVQYMVEQNLIARPIALEELFVPLPGVTD
jgi:4,5-dihydroxyphthalate decarboxylase